MNWIWIVLLAIIVLAAVLCIAIQLLIHILVSEDDEEEYPCYTNEDHESDLP